MQAQEMSNGDDALMTSRPIHHAQQQFGVTICTIKGNKHQTANVGRINSNSYVLSVFIIAAWEQPKASHSVRTLLLIMRCFISIMHKNQD